jgi:hypothetical protein
MRGVSILHPACARGYNLRTLWEGEVEGDEDEVVGHCCVLKEDHQSLWVRTPVSAYRDERTDRANAAKNRNVRRYADANINPILPC